ncbi:MAG: aspartate aminotransferase family protein, partial [bacterium]|nr:aspartate aminotransferase family protein [bacterium]
VKQAEKLLHVSNLFQIQPQAELAEVLCQKTFADKVFFCNSGAEANEGAVKLARKWGKKNRGENCFEIITMGGSFHGRTLAMITASGQEKLKKGFEPLVPGFKTVPFGDFESVRQAVTEKTCAVLLEPVQGEGGVRIALASYFKQLRDLCTEKKILLIFDEVQTGMGRTGTFLAHEQIGIRPDMVTMAKGLAGGLPIGALLATDAVAETFQPGDHAATFGGNPFVTSVASAVIETLYDDGLLDHTVEMGQFFLKGLKGLQAKYSFIKEVRGVGLLIGAELTIPAKPIVLKMLEEGVLINAVQEKVLRFLPPLVIQQGQIEEGLEILDEVLATIS